MLTLRFQSDGVTFKCIFKFYKHAEKFLSELFCCVICDFGDVKSAMNLLVTMIFQICFEKD